MLIEKAFGGIPSSDDYQTLCDLSKLQHSLAFFEKNRHFPDYLLQSSGNQNKTICLYCVLSSALYSVIALINLSNFLSIEQL